MRILHFADLHLGVESYGHIDPATGLSSRVVDALTALDQVVEYALNKEIDLVLFCGDAYKSRDPSQTQQREFARRIERLSSSGVPIFLLVGNHDLPHAISRATAVEIFHTLAIKGVQVANHPATYRIQTKHGPLQVVALPWARRSTLLSKEDYKGFDIDQINLKMQQALTDLLLDSIQTIDPELPAILAAHIWVEGAKAGSERGMVVGREPVLLPSNVAHPLLDYVALGHIHHHQVLASSPPVVYSGSLERLDFSDEEDEKGFYTIEIGRKGETSFDFHKVPARRFLTLRVAIAPGDLNPTLTVIRAIARREDEFKESVVRLQISIPEFDQGPLQESEIRQALKEAHFLIIAKEPQREHRTRLGGWSAEDIAPLEALKAWLCLRNTSPDRTRILLEYGGRIIEEEAAQE